MNGHGGSDGNEGAHSVAVDDSKSSSSAAASEESSWDGKDENDSPQDNSRASAYAWGRHLSFDQTNRENLDEASFQPENTATTPSVSSAVPTDQERQLLLLMLLAQVCALHDPTPRTFTVHVLELFERGILDRESIHFLFSLGLVPSSSPTALLPPSTTTDDDSSSTAQHNLSLIPAGSTSHPHRNYRNHRSMEASAIRRELEHLEQQHQKPLHRRQSDPGPPPPLPWSVEAHPLSLSRYQREFEQVRGLASGSFGTVFQATNKMDGRDYAIKRVPFSAQGYSRETLQQVVREVHCLAACHHPNVVRYYTSWLEPSWMTGSGRSSSGSSDLSQGQHLKLLNGIQHIVSGSGDSLSDDLRDYFKDPSWSSRRHQRRYSFDDGMDASQSLGHGDYTEWTVDAREYSVDDLYIGSDRHHVRIESPRGSPEKRSKYSYQTCLFIQMELCHPATLADWIRERNQKRSDMSSRVETAAKVFEQLAGGLIHVHQKGIVHRDLKPGNVLVSTVEDSVTFKIGDFGLSKLIESVSHGDIFAAKQSQRLKPQPLLLEYPASLSVDKASPALNEPAWHDPLTAGVGTASYAAPEQASSRSYGKEADIFSLGLMLLELLCCFSTEHERMQTFQDCRHRRILPDELKAYPVATRTILACTEHNPRKRPTAAYLIGIDICQTGDCSSSSSQGMFPAADETNQSMEERLAEKERALQQCKQELAEKDRIIANLLRQLNQSPLAGNNSSMLPSACMDSNDKEQSESASSSSEDGL